jgi:signal transduction histidine kinase
MDAPLFACFDFVSDAVLAHQNGRWLYANGAAANLLGAASPEALLAQPIVEVDGKKTQIALPDGSHAIVIIVSGEKNLRSVAHDFNNVLMAISPWADTLKRRYPNEEMIQKAMAAITQAIQKGRRLTEQMRESGKTNP